MITTSAGLGLPATSELLSSCSINWRTRKQNLSSCGALIALSGKNLYLKMMEYSGLETSSIVRNQMDIFRQNINFRWGKLCLSVMHQLWSGIFDESCDARGRPWFAPGARIWVSAKVLLEFGKSLLERHIFILKDVGITRLVIGAGYNADILEEIGHIGANDFVETVMNPDFALGDYDPLGAS